MTIKIAMFSQANKISGQGVGSAYDELITMLNKSFEDTFEVTINDYDRSDISHYHTVNPEFYLSTFFNKRGIKLGYVHFLPETLRGSLDLPKVASYTFDKYLLSFYKKMDHLVVVNPEFKEKLIALGFDGDKITYIPNFVNQSDFHLLSDEKKEQIRKEMSIPLDKFVVLGVGQVQQRKGIDDFVQLAKMNPNTQFIWAGGFSFGKMTDGYDRYKSIIDSPPANLLFTGIIDRDKLNDYYNIANIFLLPSFAELFPMSILEAFNCEAPVLLRNLDLYSGILKDYYLKADDVTQMDEVIKYYEADPAALEKYCLKSKEAASYYSEENVSKIWETFYKELVQ